jgi:hypothetical protein
MNPMALFLALLATVGAAGALSGGRRRNIDEDDDRSRDDDTLWPGDGSGGGDGGSTDDGLRETDAPGGTVSTPPASVTIPTPPVQTGGTGEDGGSVAPTPITGQTVALMTGRMATLAPADEDIASIRIVGQPQHGHVSVNPDKSLAVVLTDTRETGSMSFSYEVTHSDGSKSLHTVPLDVTPGLQELGWGTSEYHYMLEVDENDHVVVEHGENHRAIYVSNSEKALTLADIAAREGLTADQITGSWLAARQQYYGSSEDTALAPDAGFRLWDTISGRDSKSSNWLLLEKGYTYDSIGRLIGRAAEGESELHPLYVGSWGTGTKPEITQNVMIFQGAAKNIVIQDIHFSGGLRVLEGQNIIFDNIAVTDREMTVEVAASGITIRNSSFTDIHKEDPVNDGATWEPAMNRVSGLYISDTHGVLLEGNLFDLIGWEESYRFDASTTAGQPPSMFNHNIYIQYDSTDITLRDSIIMRGASFGTQFRSGGFLEDNVFLDNNGAVNPAFERNYTLAADNLVTSAGYKRVAIAEGALNWGIDNIGYLNTYVDNIVAHMADPNNEAEIAYKSQTGAPLILRQDPFYNDTIIWNWGNPENVDGLDPAIMNQTTIQLFTAQLLGKPDATIADLATYLRAQGNGAFDKVVDADLIIRFFQSGFGIVPDIRLEAGMLRFIPNELGEGVRWDNRLNWSTQDLPGSVNGDSVDLGGNKVIFGGTVTVDELEFGPNGGLRLEHGKLTVAGGMETGAEGATLDVNRAGQIWTEGGSGKGTLDIDVTGGRFANTGDFRMNADLTASGGQTLLGVDDARFAVTNGSRLEVLGANGKVGFDGEENGISILGMGRDGTLAFTAKDGAIGSIEEFRSGALGDAPRVMSGFDLGSGNLEIDLNELVDGSGTFTLVDVDELIGSFGNTNVAGLGNRNAEIVIDYGTDSITLKLAAGTGVVSTRTIGQESAHDSAEAALWNALTAGRATYDEAAVPVDDEEFLYDSAA